MADHGEDGGSSRVSGRRLCRVEEVPEAAARCFRFGSGPDLFAVLVARKDDALYAYENACPHLGTPLDFLPDRVLDRTGEHLLCATHGALFRIEDGYCLSGPCAGKSLRPVSISIDEGEIVLA
jgi:nitrite reductase/ring-hydroxylating ferredoxin subunit